MKKLVFLLISILAGCSSPPEPTPVQFEKANEVINPSLPYVPDFHGVIKSDVSGKGWVYEITSLSGVQARTPTFYYALAHADRIVVTTHDAGLWFRIRDLLKMEGATAVVEWRNEKSFLPEQGKIVFIKAQNEVKNVLGSVEKGKETPLKWCFRTIPERISIEEIDEIKFIQNPSEQG